MSDAFPSLQGPAIPISIFGEAATAGTKVGQAIPSTTTAIVNGTIQGIKEGQQIQQNGQAIQANDQNAQIRQNQINQLPVANAMQKAQLEREQNVNEIQALQLKSEQQTQDLQIDNVKAKLENDTNKQQQELNTRKEADAFTTQMQAGGQQQLDAVFGGKYSKLFAQKPEYYKQALQSAYANPLATPEQKQSIDNYLKRSNATDYYQKQAAQRQSLWNNAKEALLADPVTAAASTGLGVTPDQVPDNVEFVQAGRYETDDNGRIQLDNTGARIPDKNWDPKVATGAYDVVSKDGTVLYKGAPKESYTAFLKYKQERNYQDGTYGKIAANNAVGSNQPKQQPLPKPQVVNPFGMQQNNGQTAAQMQMDPFDASFAETMRVTPETLTELKEPLNALKNHVSEYVNNPRVRGTDAAITAVNTAVNTTARFIADKEFIESKALQTQYTQSDVDAYNTSLRGKIVGQARNVRQMDYLSRALGMGSPLDSLVDALTIKTPADLYYTTRRNVLEPAIKSVAQKQIDAKYQAQQKVLLQNFSTQNSLKLFQAAASGSR